MAINMVEFLALGEKQKNDPRFKTIACEEWHHTCIDEMERLKTGGFCPKYSLPITGEADEAYTRMLEVYAENAMVARDQFIRTWKMPDKIQIWLTSKNLRVTQVLWKPYVSITNSK